MPAAPTESPGACKPQYESFQLFVTGYCKSAGTLLATGAHELIMSNHGELGPLDVQLSKKDELWQRQSGLIGMDTLRALQGSAFEAFEQFFLQLKSKSGDTVSLRTATEIATETYVGPVRTAVHTGGSAGHRRGAASHVNRERLWEPPVPAESQHRRGGRAGTAHVGIPVARVRH